MRNPRVVAAVVALLALVLVGGWQARQARPTQRNLAPQPAPPVRYFTGPALTEPVPVKLVLASYTLSELDLATGTRTAIHGIPETPNGYKVFPLDGGGMLVRAQGSCPHCPGPIYVVAPGERTAVAMRWDQVLPGDRPDRLWAYTFVGGPTPDATVMYETDLAGRRTGPRFRLKPGQPLIRGTAAGLLFGGGRQLTIVDPNSGEVVQRINGDLIAASADKIAWIDHGCVTRCALLVSDLRTGTQSLYPTPGRPFRVAFGGAGRIATAVSTETGIGEHEAQVYLLSDGKRDPKPLSSPVAIGVELAWSGDYLLMSTAGGLITDGPPALSAALYHPSWDQPRRLTGTGLAGAQLVLR